MECLPTKNNYQLIVAKAKEKIEAQKELINNATEVYIRENSDFQVGDIIKISTPETPYWTFSGEKGVRPATSRLAFVMGFDLDYQDDVRYLLKQCKKDGSISKINDHYSSNDVLTLYSNDH